MSQTLDFLAMGLEWDQSFGPSLVPQGPRFESRWGNSPPLRYSWYQKWDGRALIVTPTGLALWCSSQSPSLVLLKPEFQSRWGNSLLGELSPPLRFRGINYSFTVDSVVGLG